MKKYRAIPYINLYGGVGYRIERKFLFIFWIAEIRVRNKEDAIDLCNKLNQKIDV
jgi:hypothetical protein